MIIRASLAGLAFLLAILVTAASATAFDAAETVVCSEPTKANQRVCRELEQQILHSTVRFTIKSWVVKPGETGYDVDYSSGHATVMDGRYLVTHNHFGIPLSGKGAGGIEAYGEMISLYNSAGQLVFKGPLSDFEVVIDAEETLVLMSRDEGFFEALGFSSARFASWESLPLESGVEVAQVDWDGATTRVDWVKVKDLALETGTPRLILADGVRLGASGGGIFWQGIHVANNWLFQAKVTESGELFDEATSAALNPIAVLDL